MADLDDVYNLRILELASDIPCSDRLASPDATASARSKLCGSTIAVDLNVAGERISAFGQDVKACLLGQATAAIVGREIVGTTLGELHDVGAIMRAMLKDGGPPPAGRWSDLALLQPVKDYPHRHASTLLVFEAVEKALSERAGSQATAAAASR
ncbi:MAG: iron-sulfur cluster assembly scaffold protein [Hyphomicrobiaceae bacterium]|nr:iron-sulfur cluster assembly scaffold protein [Hyphomicrobiaceae bacterium]